MSAGGSDVSAPAPRVGLVLNPKAHRARRAGKQLARALEKSGAAPLMLLTTTVDSPGTDQAATLLRAGVDLVVVAGGDGTIRQVVSELVGTGVPLAILPTGTANLFARNLGLRGRRRAPAIRTALGGIDIALDVGQVWVRTVGEPSSRQGPWPFLVMAGIGRDARAIAVTGIWLKSALGWLAYLAAAVREALRPALLMEIELEGTPRELRVWTVLFGNLPRIPGGIEVFPQARADDGMLDSLEVPLRHPGDWLVVAAHALLGWPRQVGALAYGRTTHARVVPQEPQPVQLDGDVVTDVVELEVGVAAGAMIVRVPVPATMEPGTSRSGLGPGRRRLSRGRRSQRPGS